MAIKFKKAITLYLISLLIIISIPIVSASSGITLTVSKTTANSGQDVEVPVVLSGNTSGVLAMQLSLSYDNRLIFKSIKQGEALSTLDLTPIKDFSANPCTILLEGLDADVSNGTIIILTFTAPSNSTGEFDINLAYRVGEIYDNDMNDIPTNIVNGSVIVASSGTTDPEITKSTITVSDYTKTAKTIDFDVYATSPNELTGTIIAVLYNNKRMVTAGFYPVKETVNISLNSVDGQYIKVMWWSDMNNCIPLSDVVQINLNN